MRLHPSKTPSANTPVSLQRRGGRVWPFSFVLIGLVTAVVFGVPAGVSAAGLITGSRIADDSITSRDLHDGSAITSGDVANRSLTRADFPAAKTGRRGAPGPPGATGPTGPQGNPAIGVVIGKTASPVVLAALETQTLTADCPAGTHVLNGGVTSSPEGILDIHASEPAAGGTGWAVRVHNPVVSSSVTVTVRAICVA